MPAGILPRVLFAGSMLPPRCCRRPRASFCPRPAREVLAARWPVPWGEVEGRPGCGEVAQPQWRSCCLQPMYWRDGRHAEWCRMTVDQYRWHRCSRYPLGIELPGDSWALVMQFLTWDDNDSEVRKNEDDDDDEVRVRPVVPWNQHCDECHEVLESCDYCKKTRACGRCDQCDNSRFTLCCEVCFHDPSLPWGGDFMRRHRWRLGWPDRAQQPELNSPQWRHLIQEVSTATSVHTLQASWLGTSSLFRGPLPAMSSTRNRAGYFEDVEPMPHEFGERPRSVMHGRSSGPSALVWDVAVAQAPPDYMHYRHRPPCRGHGHRRRCSKKTTFLWVQECCAVRFFSRDLFSLLCCSRRPLRCRVPLEAKPLVWACLRGQSPRRLHPVEPWNRRCDECGSNLHDCLYCRFVAAACPNCDWDDAYGPLCEWCFNDPNSRFRILRYHPAPPMPESLGIDSTWQGRWGQIRAMGMWHFHGDIAR